MERLIWRWELGGTGWDSCPIKGGLWYQRFRCCYQRISYFNHGRNIQTRRKHFKTLVMNPGIQYYKTDNTNLLTRLLYPSAYTRWHRVIYTTGRTNSRSPLPIKEWKKWKKQWQKYDRADKDGRVFELSYVLWKSSWPIIQASLVARHE